MASASAMIPNVDNNPRRSSRKRRGKEKQEQVHKKMFSVDLCAICLIDATDLCMYCQDTPAASLRKGCPIAWGECEHAFHLHCITHWIKVKRVCPLDNTEWKFLRVWTVKKLD